MQGLGLDINKKINYKLVRSNRKTLALHIDIYANLIVRSPQNLSVSKIEKYIESKSDWVTNKIKTAQSKATHLPEYIENEKFLFLGNMYPLVFGNQEKDLLFDGNKFVLSSDDGKKSFLRWYMEEFNKIAIPRLSYYAKKYQFQYNKVRIKAQKTVWGSCSSTDNINLNYLLIMAPIHVIDYVIVHELCHTINKSHSKKFWSLVDNILPNYKESKSWLKENGYRLHNL
jgi:hypothetical protein